MDQLGNSSNAPHILTQSPQNLTSLPLISESITSLKTSPYTKKSYNLSHSTYQKLLAPYVNEAADSPLYTKYISPYVQKADDLASGSLSNLESKFPIVKEQPSVIRSTLYSYATAPIDWAFSAKDHVLSTYESEYKNCGADASKPITTVPNLVAGVKASITTSLTLTSDILAHISAFVSTKRDQSRDFASAKYHQAQSMASQATRYAQDKRGEAWTYANEKGGEVWGYAQNKGEEVKGMAYASGKELQEGAEKTKARGEAKGREVKEKATSK